MFKKLILAASLITIVAGCTVNKTLTATGGSKSGGFIELSYTIGAFEKPIVDWNSGLQTAIKRCNAWGYNNAESFGGQKRKCASRDMYNNCSLTRVYINYQCTDSDK